MQLTITIDCDNAAFEPCDGTEAARILRECADIMDGLDLIYLDDATLRDANGNQVGRVRTTQPATA